MTKEKSTEQHNALISNKDEEILELSQKLSKSWEEMMELKGKANRELAKALEFPTRIAEILDLNVPAGYLESMVFVEIGKLLEIKNDKVRKYMGTEYTKDDDEEIEWDQYK